MKYFLILALTLISFQSKAGFYDSEYFEPTVLCVVGGGVLYSGAPEGDEAVQGAIGCAAGAIVGIIVNKYYKKKVYANHENKINGLKNQVNRKVVKQAQRAYTGQNGKYYSIEADQIIKSQELPTGEILSPTKRIILKAP